MGGKDEVVVIETEETQPFIEAECRRAAETSLVAVENNHDSPRLDVLKSFVLLMAFFAVNIIISVYNKWLFNGPLRCPMFVTMTHQLFCFIVCTALLPWKKPTKIRSWKSYMKVLTLPIFFIFNIGLNNLSLLYTTLALNQLIRAFCPVLVVMLAFLVEDKIPSIASGAAVLTLVLGVTLSVATSPDLEFFGTAICFASVLGSGLQTVTVSHLKVIKMDPLSLVFHTSPINVITLIPLMFILGEQHQLRTYIEEGGTMKIIGLTLIGGVIALGYNLILMSFIQHTSSTYSAVAGSFKTVLVLVASFLFFHQKLNFLSTIGMGIAFVGFMSHSYLLYREKMDKGKMDLGAEVAEGVGKKL